MKCYDNESVLSVRAEDDGNVQFKCLATSNRDGWKEELILFTMQAPRSNI